MNSLKKKTRDRHFKNQVHQTNRTGWILRSEARIACRSRAKIKELKTGIMSNAEMRHYSADCVYVEADTLLLPGTKIYLGIENSPFTPFSNIVDVYRAEVISLRHLKCMPHAYGYDIELIIIPKKST